MSVGLLTCRRNRCVKPAGLPPGPRLCPTSHRTAIVADITQLVNYLFGQTANYLFGAFTDVLCHRLIRTRRWSDEARARPGGGVVGCVVAGSTQRPSVNAAVRMSLTEAHPRKAA